MRVEAWIGLGASLALAALVALGPPGAAAPPQETSWSSLTLEGAPVDTGFVDTGEVVYATTDTGSIPSDTTFDCSVSTGAPADTDDADLFLITFPGGEGCTDALDTSDTAEGTTALDTASRSDRAVVAVPNDGTSGLDGPNVLVYEVDDGNLSEEWTATLDGQVLDVATDPDARRFLATFETGSSDFRLAVLSAAGDLEDTFRLPGQPRTLSVSEDGRWVAVGGNTTQGNSSIGWAHLYDLSLSDQDNPVVDRTIPRPRAGIVTDTVVDDETRFFVGLLDGTVRHVSPSGDDREAALGTDPAHLSLGSEADTVFAASSNETARFRPTTDALQQIWRTDVNGTSQQLASRAPHVFVAAENLEGLSSGGEDLWETTSGDVLDANRTGLGLAVATETASGDQGTRTSSLRGLTLQRNLTVAQDGPVEITPGSVVRTQLTFTNGGAAVLNLTPTAAADDVSLTTRPATFSVLPGEDRTVTATIRADRDAEPGSRSISLSLDAKPGLSTDHDVQLDVAAQPDVSLSLAEGQASDRTVTQGQQVTIRLVLENAGNADTSVELSVDQSVEEDWDVAFRPSSTVTVPAGSATTARVDIEVAPGADNGTRNALIVRGSSDAGATAVETNLTVNPFLVIRMRPATVSQKLAPGATNPFDLTVENLGSVDAQVTLDAQPIGPDDEPCLPTAWGVALAESGITVPAEGSRPVRAEISAPAEIPVPGVENGTTPCTSDAERPSLRVKLTARAQEGPPAESLLFATVDPSLAEEPEELKREPFPAMAALATVVAVALAAPGRSDP